MVDATSVAWIEHVIMTTVLPSRDQLLRFAIRRAARVGELRLNLAIAVQVAECFRRGDDGGDERPAFGRLAQLLDSYAVAGFSSSA